MVGTSDNRIQGSKQNQKAPLDDLHVNIVFRQKHRFKIQSILVHYATQFLSTVRFPANIRIPRSINYETNQLTCERNQIVKELLRFRRFDVQSDR